MNIKIADKVMVKLNRRDLRTAFYKPKYMPKFLWIWFLDRFKFKKW